MKYPFLIIVIIIMFTGLVFGQETIEIGNISKPVNVKYKALSIIDTTGYITSKNVHEKDFSKINNYKTNQKSFSGKYWLKLNFENKSFKKKSIIIFYNYVFFNYLKGYELQNNNLLQLNSINVYTGVFNLNNVNRIGNIKIDFDSFQKKTIYIELNQPISIYNELDFFCTTTNIFYRLNTYSYFSIIFYAGFICPVILVSFIFYFIQRNKIFLFYALANISIIFGGIHMDGFLKDITLFKPINEIIIVNIFAAIAIIFYTYYVKYFLDIKNNSLYKYLSLYGILYILTPLFLKENQISIYWQIGFLSVVIIIIINIIYISKSKNRVNKLFLLVSLAPLILVAQFYHFDIFIFKTSFFNSYTLGFTFKAAYIFETIILSIAIIFQYRNSIKTQLELSDLLISTQKDLIFIQDFERNRIARDLHDEIGSSLLIFKGLLNANKISPLLSEKLQELMIKVRNIAHNIKTIDFDYITLPEAIKSLIIDYNNVSEITYTFDYFGEYSKINNENEMVIYRVITECLNNIEKHSFANKAEIQLVYFPQNLQLSIVDDGIGISINEDKVGIGLKNIKTRVKFLKGNITIEPDKFGTIININIPLQPI